MVHDIYIIDNKNELRDKLKESFRREVDEYKFKTVNTSELEVALKDSYAGVEKLVLDFAELEYLSSAGLRVLLGAQKTMNKQGEMVVKNVNDTIDEIFEITGFADVLTIE